MVRNIVVTKKPRDVPIKDIPQAFPSFDNLHLELMENKKKLKSGLPLIIPKKFIPAPQKSDSNSQEDDKKHKKHKKHKDKKHKKHKKHEKSDGSEIDQIILDVAVSSSEEEVEIKKSSKNHKKSSKTSGESDDDNVKRDVGESEDTESEESEEIKEDEEDDPYAGLSPEERIIKEREEYIWRFRILKRQYKNANIPDYNEHSDLTQMKTSYNRTLKEVYLDEAVDTYRGYLIGGFAAMEWVCTKWMDIDLGGFTRQQTKMMPKYERLLIELGEKSYGSWGSNLPVEIRLIGVILFNAAIFYISKVLAEKDGGNAAEFFRAITGQPVAPVDDEVPKPTKMKGPKFKPEDLKNK